MEIVRTEPRELAPVIPLPERAHASRIIRPVDVAPGTPLAGSGACAGPTGLRFAPGPLARALRDAEAGAER